MRDSRASFGPVAERYLNSSDHANEADLAHCVTFAEPKGGPILDVATGAGHTAYTFAPHAEKVLAIDITPEMVATTRRVASERGIANLEAVLMQAEELCFPADSFEGVTCRLGAHHFRDVRRFLEECYRVIRPNGWLLVVDTIGIDDPLADEALDRIEFQRDPSHVRNYTVNRWIEMVSAAGFCAEKHEESSFPINARNWLERMQVSEPVTTRLMDEIAHSEGWLRDYLRPTGEGDTLTFRLHRIMLLARKPE